MEVFRFRKEEPKIEDLDKKEERPEVEEEASKEGPEDSQDVVGGRKKLLPNIIKVGSNMKTEIRKEEKEETVLGAGQTGSKEVGNNGGGPNLRSYLELIYGQFQRTPYPILIRS